MNRRTGTRPTLWTVGTVALWHSAVACPLFAQTPKEVVNQWVQPSRSAGAAHENNTSSMLASRSSPNDGMVSAKPIYWNKKDFVIPFNVSSQGKLPSAVELEVSTDNGVNWAAVQRSEVGDRQFAFRSRGDGLYHFRIKTIDEEGRSFNTSATPLAIIIDTNRPEIDFLVDTDEQARMTADFRIADANFIEQGIRLEYQTELDANWVSVPVQTQPGRSDMEVLGKAVWEVPVRARQLVVRLIVRDLAGNESEVTRLPNLLRTADSGAGLQLASNGKSMLKQFFGGEEANPAVGPTILSAEPSLVLPIAPENAFTNAGQAPEMLPTPPIQTSGPSEAYGAPQGSMQMVPIDTEHSSALQIGEDSTDSIYVSKQAVAPVNSAMPGTQLRIESTPPPSNVATIPSGSTNNIQSQRPIPGDMPPPVGSSSLPAGAAPFASNSRAFSLDYSVETDPSNQVAAIELWGTTDGGRSWSQWGIDPDKRSPFDIKVQNDGLFGFRMVVVGSNGLANHRPSSGDDADAWIEVDTKLPTTRILAAQYGRGVETGSLVIEYTAADERLSQRPITLSYAVTPEGPWTTIEADVPNNGRYLWPGNPNLPRRVYLRIEAYDQAGNVAIDRMELPVDLEGLAPRGRIQGFRPIAD